MGDLRGGFSPVVVAFPRSRADKVQPIATGIDARVLGHLRTVGVGDGSGGGDRTGIRNTDDCHRRRLGHSEVGDAEGFVPVDIAGIEDSGRGEVQNVFWGIGFRPGRGVSDINPARASTGTRLIETGLESCSWRTRSDSEASSSIKGTDTAILTDREIAQGIRWCNRRITAGTSDDSGSSHAIGIGWPLTGCSERDICWSCCIAATAAVDSPGICRTAVVCRRDAGIPVSDWKSWSADAAGPR